jgi:hypothetical protein
MVVAPRFVRAVACVVAPVPPLATAKVPAIVMVPEVVIGPPEVVKPVVPPETATEVTVPDPPVAAIVIDPAPLVMDIFEPAVRVALERVLPVVLPIKSCPLVYVVCPVPPLATGKVPVTPVDNGRPVAFVSVTDCGVPRIGVTRVGEVEKTNEPDPVSSVTAAARFAEEGVPSQVATPAPKDVIPVPPLVTGRVPVIAAD